MKRCTSELPSGVMAALLAGWVGHDPVIHQQIFVAREGKKWVSLFAPHDGPNADWFGEQANFELEPIFEEWLQLAADRKQREIASAIMKALGLK